VIVLQPVLLPLPVALPRRARHPHARAATARVLRACARLAGAPTDLPFEAWPRDPRGAPAPVRGWHASLADTRGAVVGLLAPLPAAVDVEWIERPRWEVARERFRSDGDLVTLGSSAREDVLALWTAKEAVLKLAGIGLADLAHVPLIERHGETFTLVHRGNRRCVRVVRHGAHLVAVATVDETIEVALRSLEPVQEVA
jgi:hypothetical protein